MNNRISPHEYFMYLAEVTALRSTCPRAHVGALVVNDGKIVSTGYNGAPRGCEHCMDVGCLLGESGKCYRVVHAEMNALLTAPLTHGCTLFCTHTPCWDCCHMLINAQIAELVISRHYHDSRVTSFAAFENFQGTAEEFQLAYIRQAGISVRRLELDHVTHRAVINE